MTWINLVGFGVWCMGYRVWRMEEEAEQRWCIMILLPADYEPKYRNTCSHALVSLQAPFDILSVNVYILLRICGRGFISLRIRIRNLPMSLPLDHRVSKKDRHMRNREK